MLTWGGLNIIGAPKEYIPAIEKEQKLLVDIVKKEINALEVESDENGWLGKVYLYCVEVICPESGWKVPQRVKFRTLFWLGWRTLC